ncbi:YkgJ family cysteine cluster protein [Thermococcus sp. M39]|uniref:YkgJ family cysteine cluster protein n=1 Tax=unclassified Thermococcus TaxID=2627626 RepID=UPI0014394E99|nr:YkgJ family cysteine cluster protein [Thermococcus sp. M39]NJE12514.1 YkgJ family cysteine cluster protein [Thermococcus sp. LS2]
MKKKWVATIHLDTLEIESDPSFKFKCLENCAECCFRLDIPLRDEDIERIEELGYSTWEFVDYEKMFYRGDKFLGYALKKRPFDDGCIFLGEDGKCKIYPHRPLACKLYPFVLVRQGTVIEVYVRNDDFCRGINHPEGKKIDLEFVREYFWEVIERYRQKLGFSGKS